MDPFLAPLVALVILTAMAVTVAVPIAISAYRNPDRRLFGVTAGDQELTGQVFG